MLLGFIHPELEIVVPMRGDSSGIWVGNNGEGAVIVSLHPVENGPGPGVVMTLDEAETLTKGIDMEVKRLRAGAGASPQEGNA